MLARKSLITRLWMATGKKVYYAITRGLNFTDREGRGLRFVRDAPEIAARLRSHPQVRDVAIVPSRTAAPAPGSMPSSRAARAMRELLDFLGDGTARSICRSSTRCRATRRAKCAAKSSNWWR